MYKKVLVTGSNGQLGSELRSLANHSTFNIKHLTFHFIDRNDLDLSDTNAIEAWFADKQFDVIVNCAAYTAVDKAESEPELAKSINHKAVETLARISKAKKIALIHISTDYVFDGSNYKPYVENDHTNPQGVYGQTKLDGEEAMLAINPPNSLIIRTSWVYSSYGNNFVKTMLRLGRERDELGVIFDQVGTPTYARDLAEAVLQILNAKLEMLNEIGSASIQHSTFNIQHSPSHTEIFNFSNEGVASWYDFAKAIFELSGVECSVKPIETKEYPTPAVRPHYSLLNKSKIKSSFGLEIPYWRESLKECIAKILDGEC